MFFKDEYEYTIIENVELKELEFTGLDLDFDSSNRWAAYTIYRAKKEGLNNTAQLSMASIVSGFMGGLVVSASTDYYFKEEKIDHAVIDELNRLQDTDLSEPEKVKALFNFILDLYKQDIEKYERKIQRINPRLTQSQYEKFQSVEGETASEKLATLLDLL